MRAATRQVVTSPEAADSDDIDAFAQTFVQLVRSTNHTRQQLISAARDNVEWSAVLIMSYVLHEGPLRASALAEHLQSDPSTISRQVAGLVRDGLLERLADPLDGRACLLELTPGGRDVVRQHAQARNEHFRRMLADWSEGDVQQFTALLRRFAEDYERYRPNLFPGNALASGEES